MKKIIVILGALALNITACSSGDGGIGAASQRVVLDVRCAVDSDCPSGFECEDEVEHGVDMSYCVSHGSDHAASGECPAGFELELEHGQTFCKPHGGDDASGSDDGSAPQGGGECASDADCPSGLECEIETEHGVTTSYCKEHGGNT